MIYIYIYIYIYDVSTQWLFCVNILSFKFPFRDTEKCVNQTTIFELFRSETVFYSYPPINQYIRMFIFKFVTQWSPSCSFTGTMMSSYENVFFVFLSLALCEWNPTVTSRFHLQRTSNDVSMMLTQTNGWTNNQVVGELRQHDVHVTPL